MTGCKGKKKKKSGYATALGYRSINCKAYRPPEGINKSRILCVARALFPDVRRPEREDTHFHLVTKLRICRTVVLSPSTRLHSVGGVNLIFTLLSNSDGLGPRQQRHRDKKRSA